MNLPKISVIIPAYNRSKTILRAVQSVLAQTYRDFELIVVDDGSSDDTRQKLASISDARFRYIWQENQERSAARNNGVRASQGEYIAFLDSDDEYLPDKLEVQVQYLDQHPEIGMALSGWVNVDEEGGRQICTPWIEYPGQIPPSAWLMRTPVHFCATLMRRTQFEAVGGFDLKLAYPEDVDLLLRMVLNGCRTGWVGALVLNIYTHNLRADQLAGILQYRLYLLEKTFQHRERLDHLEHLEALYGTYTQYILMAFHLRDAGLGLQFLHELANVLPGKAIARPDWILRDVYAWLGAARNRAPVAFAELLLAQDDPLLAWMHKERRHLLSAAWEVQAFRAHVQKQYRNARQCMRKAVGYRPGRLLNRGNLAVLLGPIRPFWRKRDVS
jgi:glycosyltransferase involved in cell wall biosynthesis